MNTGIILLGSEHVGKKLVGQYLADRLQLPYHDLTVEDQPYLKLTAFESAKWGEIYRTAGFEGVFRYMMPIRAQVVIQALSDFGPAIIKLGDFDSVYEDPALLAQVKQAFLPYAHVCHLQPTPNLEASIRILEDRARITIKGMDWNEYYVRHPANQRLAKKVLYTKDQAPDETVAAILAQLDRRSKDIFLLGPVGTGKTTTGNGLSSALNIPQVSMDGIRRQYYAEIGYSKKEEQRLLQIQGFEAVLDYWNQFDLHAIKRALEAYPGRIIDFGAGQTTLKTDTELTALESLLAPYPNVFLLLPSPQVEESVAILQQRQRLRTSIGGIPMIPFQLRHPSNSELSDSVVYTVGKTVAQISQEILSHAQLLSE